MKLSRREFIQTSAIAGVAGSVLPASAPPTLPDRQSLDAFAIARRHRLVTQPPTPGFFEGMLLGNGDIGVCAVVRPDALGLHIAKNDVWDIRVSEDIEKYVLTFKDLLDENLRCEYCREVNERRARPHLGKKLKAKKN